VKRCRVPARQGAARAMSPPLQAARRKCRWRDAATARLKTQVQAGRQGLRSRRMAGLSPCRAADRRRRSAGPRPALSADRTW